MPTLLKSPRITGNFLASSSSVEHPFPELSSSRTRAFYVLGGPSLDDVFTEYCNNKFLSPQLADLNPEDTVLVSDMTGTILKQSPTGIGFPLETRALINDFLSRGGKLLLVTGDTTDVAKAQCINHLDADPAFPYYIISGAGFELVEVRGKSITQISRGERLDEDAKEQIFQIVLDYLKLSFPSFSGVLSQEELQSLSMGIRVDISETLGLENADIVYIEAADNKITLFMPEHENEYDINRDILSEIACDDAINKIARENKYHIKYGPNYIDIITSTKDQGLRRFMDYLREQGDDVFHKFFQKKNILVAGDSPNDEEMMKFEGWTTTGAKSVHMLYLGKDDAPFPSWIDRFNRGYHLPGAHVTGFTTALKIVCFKF